MNKHELVNYLNELYPDAHCELNYSNEYELLIAVILSAQTTDKKVNSVTNILFEKYDCFDKLALADFEEIKNIINPLGLANNKTKSIIETAKIVVNQYNGVIPQDKKTLKTLPGVGEKVAAVFLGNYYNQEEFPVDTHILRISKRLELSNKNDPTKVSDDLKKYFKGYSFIKLHHQLIFLGRYMCSAKNPNCNLCKIKCNYFKKNMQNKSKNNC